MNKPGPKRNTAKDDRIAHFIRDGLCAWQIQKIMGCDYRRVMRVASENGLEVKRGMGSSKGQNQYTKAAKLKLAEPAEFRYQASNLRWGYELGTGMVGHVRAHS